MTSIKVERAKNSVRGSSVDLLDPEVTNIRELIDRMAETLREAPFLVSPETGQVLTFLGLKEQSVVLCTQLQQLGLEPGDKVAFLLDNSLFTAQLFLGVMYGGCVSVPLNVRAGVSQLSYMVEHCDAKVVFVGDEYAALVKEVMAQVRRPVRVIPSGRDCIGAIMQGTHTAKNLASVPSSEDVALLMYTSGSTGYPKAAVHTHRTILAGARNSVAAHRLTAADRSLLVLPLYHINAECVTLVPTLLSGGSVAVPRQFSISHFWDWLDDCKCTWSAIVPTIVSQLLDWHDPKADQRGPAFRRIRFLRSSSAPLAPSLHREFLAKFPLLLIQAMGSSEGGNIFSNPLPPLENKIGSPGLPWGFEVKIVDRDGKELPAAEPGEMLIRGEAMSCAYFKEPEATAAAFDSEGWLHTGDLACRDGDGYFFVVGRSKELIIKGGVNIAPRQIDDVLESHPAVLEAAAVGVPERHLGEDVVAFVVLRAGVECDERELLGFCEDRLGHFKTPTRIHFVEDLPKGPSGKVQRLRLLEQTTKLDASGVAAAPLGFALGRSADQKADEAASALPASIERVIADVWVEVLKVREVGVDDNFFALGGDSLMAIQCVSRLRDKIAIRLTLTDFFENGTVGELVEMVRERHAAASRLSDHSLLVTGGQIPGVLPTGNVQEILPRDRALPYQLSPLQERLWFMERLNPGQPVYNEVEAVRLRGDLNVEALERALNAVIARHEVLRTTIQAEGGVGMARVLESYTLRLKMVDLAGRDAVEREAELERLLISEPRVPYRLEVEPAIRATLIRLAEHEHVFILMMHHLICDWSSEGVLWRELSELYRAYCRNESSELPPLALQHGDYAVWQRGQLTETAMADDLAYWVDTLRGAPPLLEIPSDRPRPQLLSYRGGRLRFRINHALTDAFRELSRRERKSLFALFTAAFDLLLYRYTGQENILLGVPIAERDRPGFQSMIGFLLHTHVLRTLVEGDLTFRELVGRVQQAALKLYEHRSAPFDRVVRAIQPERSLSYSPLFQVMVNWRDRDQELCFIGMEGLEIESVLVNSKISKFDLTLFLTDMGEEIWAEMEYSTDLFDTTSIERMFRHYQTILEAVAADPNQRVREIPLLAETERHQLLVEWNDTKVDYPICASIHEPFEAEALRSPDQVAVVFERQALSYGELNRRANQLAHHLKGLGIGPNVLVGLCVKRSLEMVVGLLGILKAGAAYVPMDPSYPKERLQYILEDSEASVVLTQESLVDGLPSFAGRAICLDKDWVKIAGESAENLTGQLNLEDLAYVIFTSGSTGRPKGVEISHRAVINFLNSMRERPRMEAQDTLLSVTTLSFDIFGLELWLPLTSGAKVVIASTEVTRDGKLLAALMGQSGATIMQATPSTWRLLLESGWGGNPHLKILCGGEAWPAQLAEQLLPRCASLWNMYGPTETTIWSAVHQVRAGMPVLIGHPIANTEFYVIDSHSQPVPVGVPGELLIGGAGLAHGYLNRPDLTAERFIPDPIHNGTASRLYRTGDLVRYRADGTLEFLGRIDQQVKVRGFRIELGEIESVLRSHAAVREAVVVMREEREKQIIGYVVPAGGPSCTTAELRDYLKQKLPAYMVPADYVVLDSLPVTPNGKVDRLALCALRPSDSLDDAGYLPPQDAYEALICQAWADVLGVKRVGIRDNFFDLGGHSLLAMQLMLRLQEIIPGEPLPLRAVLEAPTVEKFAAWLRSHKAGERQFLVRVRPGISERPPFFTVHGAGGNVLDMRALAMALPADLPFYCFEDKGLDGSAPFESIEKTARCYIEEIRHVQPHGPYYLGGWCYGGIVAFEMARRLEELGEPVAALILIDTLNPAFARSLSRGQRLLDNVRFYMRRTVRHARRIFTRPPSEWFSYISGPLKHFRDRVLDPAKALAILDEERVSSIPSNPIGEILKRIMRANLSARRNFSPKPYNGRASIFRASDRYLYQYDDHYLGWGSVVRGGVECFEIEGAHEGLLDQPAVQLVAEKLDTKLKELATETKDICVFSTNEDQHAVAE